MGEILMAGWPGNCDTETRRRGDAAMGREGEIESIGIAILIRHVISTGAGLTSLVQIMMAAKGEICFEHSIGGKRTIK